MADKKQVADKKTELTVRTINNIRASSNVFAEFVKAAAKYQEQALKLSEAGLRLSESLRKVGQIHYGDVGEGIQKLAEIVKNIETKREKIARSIDEDLIVGLQKTTEPDKAELAQFENDLKKSRGTTRQQIQKLEVASKKAGKIGPEALKQSISNLNDKVKEVENVKAEKLRTVLLLERKKFCNFLTQWNPVLRALSEYHQEGHKIQENEPFCKQLAGSQSQLPSKIEDLVKQQQERTFVQIQADPSTYGSSYYDPGSYDEPSGGNGSCTALYDYAGEQPEDLAFYAGDVIHLLKEDDGSGWLEGELNGQVGIFPSSYVQRN